MKDGVDVCMCVCGDTFEKLLMRCNRCPDMHDLIDDTHTHTHTHTFKDALTSADIFLYPSLADCCAKKVPRSTPFISSCDTILFGQKAQGNKGN